MSVLTPAYNSAAFVGAAIESVLRQDMSDLELIVVDDGSTDSTGDVSRAYDDPRVHVIRQGNGGECAARNTALGAAHGELIAFLDADDEYLPGALRGLSSFLDSNPDIDVVYSDGWFTDTSGTRLLTFSDHRHHPYEGNLLEPIACGESVIVSICGTMIRRSFLLDQSLTFDPTLKIGGDWDFWIRAARHARFGYLDEFTCVYRVHGSNVTSATAVTTRRHFLAQIRTRTIEADWFDEMSLSARTRIVRNLLIGVQGGDTAAQRTTLELSGVRRLPSSVQSDMLRWVAVDHLRTRGDTEFARHCLDRAMELEPDNAKARLLGLSLTLNGSAARWLATSWHTMRSRRPDRLRPRQPANAPDALLRAITPPGDL